VDLQREFFLHTFPNGIRWIHKQVSTTKLAHCGIMLDIGSRDEKPEEIGLAHFWEHMAFKGTEHHNSRYILNRIDNLGGELNAYTTKEKICFHSSLLGIHFEKAIELLVDITFFSTFPHKEIEKEKQVILEEMAMYADSPEDAIQDDFDALVFEGNSLGNNILGTKQSVSSFTQTDFKKFISSNINTEKLIISTVSAHDTKSAFKLIEKYCKEIPRHSNQNIRSKPVFQKPKISNIIKPITQAHCMLGIPTFSIVDEKRLLFFMLTNYLGGSAMNARLNLALREKYGFVYTVDAQYSPFTDTGVFSIYFGTEKKHIKKAYSLVWAELKKLKDNALTISQLKVVKEQFKGQLAMSEENNNGLMLLMAKSMLDLGRVESLDSIFQKIDAITPIEFQSVAQIFKEEDFYQLNFIPEK
jgi:predicted Zn-dependent peptidase